MIEAFDLSVTTLRVAIDLITTSPLLYFVGLAILGYILRLLCKYIFLRGG